MARLFYDQYADDFKTTSEKTRTMEVQQFSSSMSCPIESKPCTYLTFTQEEKSMLKKLKCKTVYTIHEAQGNTYKNLICVGDNQF